MKKKVLWIIERLDGTTTRVLTEETMEPIPGDGKIIDGIPVAIISVVTTPLSGELEKHDLVVAAKEQRI